MSPKRKTLASAEAPKNWESILSKITKFRSLNKAPVDTLGCTSQAETTNEKTYRYQILVSLQLSSQTKDQVNAATMTILKKHGLTVDNVIETSVEDLNEMIKMVGFHNKKAVYMKQTAAILKEKYEGDVPSTIAELLELPGIGPKMGYLYLQEALGLNEGIGVDTHVHRISNRLGFVKSKTAEETRHQLEDWLPPSYWKEINKTFVGFGQIHCLPLKPKCQDCVVKDMCLKRGVK